MITSSGSVSPSTRGSSCSVLPRTFTPSIRSPRLRGSSSRKPTGCKPSPRLRTISRSTRRPPSPAPTIRTLRSPLRPTAEGGQRAALVDRARTHPHPAQEQHAQQTEQHHHTDRQHHRHGDPVRVAVHRARHLDTDDAQQDDQHDRPQNRLVVPLAGVTPAALVNPRQDEHDQASTQYPPNRPFEQQLIVVWQLRAPASAVLEAQRERQVVRERDQRPVHRELRQGMSVYGKGRRADPSAHWLIVRAAQSLSGLSNRSTRTLGSRRTRLAGPVKG